MKAIVNFFKALITLIRADYASNNQPDPETAKEISHEVESDIETIPEPEANKERCRRYYQKNRKLVLQRMKTHNQKHRKEYLEIQLRSYYKHRERRLKKQREYYQKNRERILEKMRNKYSEQKQATAGAI